MKRILIASMLGLLFAVSGCGDDENAELPPPKEQKGSGGLAGDDKIKQEQEKLEQLLKQPKKTQQK